MGNKIELDDFRNIIVQMREILDIHQVENNKHKSIILSMLFNFTYLLDEKQKTCLHDDVHNYFETNLELFNVDVDEFLYP